MKVDAIQNGIVIDHITAGDGMRLFELLKLDRQNASVALIMNAQSAKLGKKDIIKIDADISVDFDIIGYVAPDATVNIIKNGVLSEKRRIGMPDLLRGVISCKNPRCISSCEQELPNIFRLTDKENKIYRCIYCETMAN